MLVLRESVESLKLIKLNQEAWLNPYIDINSELRKNEKMILKNIFSSWWIMHFLKRYKKCKKTYRYQVCNNQSNKEFFSIRTKLSYNNFFSKSLLAIEMKRTQTFRNKPVYFDLSILKISKMVIYEFSCDYVDTDSIIVDIKTKVSYSNIAKEDLILQIIS